MIEDDLRGLLADAMDVDVYARMIPMELPECVVVQEIGGEKVDAGIRRNRHTISVMAVSYSQASAIQRMKAARNFLTTHIPTTVSGTHYYTAKALADGSLKRKSLNGPKYIEFVDMTVEASI